MRFVRDVSERLRRLREEPVGVPPKLARHLAAQRQQMRPLAGGDRLQQRGAALEKLPHVGPTGVGDGGREGEERRAVLSLQRVEQMRRGVQAVGGQLIGTLRHHIDERREAGELLQGQDRQQTRPNGEEHGRQRDRLPVAAVEMAAQHRPFRQPVLVQVSDGAGAGLKVRGSHHRGVFGQVTAGVHPAPEDLGAERADDFGADPKVLRRGLPGAERVLCQRHALLRPGAKVGLGQGGPVRLRRTQLLQRAAELLDERGAVVGQPAFGLSDVGCEAHGACIVASGR